MLVCFFFSPFFHVFHLSASVGSTIEVFFVVCLLQPILPHSRKSLEKMLFMVNYLLQSETRNKTHAHKTAPRTNTSEAHQPSRSLVRKRSQTRLGAKKSNCRNTTSVAYSILRLIAMRLGSREAVYCSIFDKLLCSVIPKHVLPVGRVLRNNVQAAARSLS